MVRLLFFVVLWNFACFSQEEVNYFDLANFHGEPSALVGGHVNVITGDFIDYEKDCVLPAPVPFVLDRVYSSSDNQNDTFGCGWHISYNHSARWDLETYYGNEHHFTVLDGLGTNIRYRGLHGHRSCAGGYRAEKELWKLGMTNISSEGISGTTNVNNDEAWIDFNSGNLRYANGDVLFFRPIEPTTFHITYLPTYKTKLNRLKEAYTFNNDKQFTGVELFGSGGTQLGSFQFIQMDADDQFKRMQVAAPNGNIDYFYKKKQTHFYLHKVVRPNAPEIKYEYCFPDYKYADHLLLTKKEFPNNRYVEVSYFYKKAGGTILHHKRPHGAVQSISKPLGETDAPHKEFEFAYNRHRYNKKDSDKQHLFNGQTEVTDALGCKRIFFFKKNRLRSIDSYLGKDKYKTENFWWGNTDNGYHEGYYIGKSIVDACNHEHVKSYVVYDSAGNVIKENLIGNLTGLNLDTYFKERSYSKDGKNLLLEEWDYKKKVIYRYLEGTNLLAAKFLTDHQKICKREFFVYDVNGFKIKEVIDDGSSEDIEDLSGVSERLITEYKARTSYPFGLAEEVVLKALDLTTGSETQLKRSQNKYSIEGWLEQVDVFDANDLYSYSKKYRYNNFGKVTYAKDPMGAVIEYAYDDNGNKIEEKGPLPGFRRVFIYDFCNRLIKEEEILENENMHLVKSYRYNLKSERIEETDYSGNQTAFTYDDLGREIGIKLPVFYSEEGFCHLKTSTKYDLLDHPCEKTDPKGNKTVTHFTARGKPYSIEYPDGNKEKNTYELDGTLIENIDKYGNKTFITSDYLGRPICHEVYDLFGHLLRKTTSEYNAFHLIKETDALGCTTSYDYDFAGRLVRKKRGNSVEEYAYDRLSRLYKTITWTKANDAVVVIKRFDKNDRVIEERTESLSGVLQAKVNYAYNALGKKIKEVRKVDSKDAVTRFIYNARGDLIEAISPLGTSTKIEYDYCYCDDKGERGTRTISIDPKGVQTIVDKNPLGLEKRVEKKNSLGETLQLFEVLYNSMGEKSKRLETVYIAGRPLRQVTTSWKWDSLGRLQSLTEALMSPEEKTTSIIYNNYSQQETIIKPSGLKIHFAYDILGRMSRWYGSDGSFDYRYQYDAMDNPIHVYDEVYGTATTKTYNIEGRLAEEMQGNGLIVRYGYDLAGRVTSFIYPDDSSVGYEYEGSRIRTIRRFSPSNIEKYHFQAIEYDYLGKLKKGKFPLKAGEFNISYDLMGRTTNVRSTHWKEHISAYDAAGNLLNRTVEDSTGTLNESYLYDELNQLIEENGSAAHKYRFDSLYNRVKEDDTENAINDLNQTLERKDRSYRYDADGNLIELQKPDKKLNFGYDAAGRMTSFTDGSTIAYYRYDGTNRRIAKVIDTETTRYIYNGQCELGTFDHGGEVRILGGLGLGAEIGDAIAIEKGDSILAPLHDHNGNLMSLVDAKTGLSVYHARYSAFGIETLKEGDGVSWGFSSKRKDSESGFIFFGRRFYDPESGRFITKDPLGDRDGPNLYAYVSNNPLMFVDLWGLCANCDARNAESSESSWYQTGVDYFWSGVEYLQSGVEYVGSCIESFSHHCLPSGPFQYIGRGIGRTFQGQSFTHKDSYANPLYKGTRYGYEMGGATSEASTGMLSNDPDAISFANSISEGLGGAEVGLQCHRSSGTLSDSLGIALLLLGMQTDITRSKAESIKEDYFKMKNAGFLKPLIARFEHSRGGIELSLALKLLPPEIKSCVMVYTFGSYPIPPDGLRGAINFVNPNDIVSKLLSIYCRGNGANIVYTDYQTNGMFNFLEDHLLKTDGYQRAIRHACNDFQEKWKASR